MTTTKCQMKVISARRGVITINCFPGERQYMAGLARMYRAARAKYGDARKTLFDLRTRAAERYL